MIDRRRRIGVATTGTGAIAVLALLVASGWAAASVSGSASVASNFNATNVPSGDVIWFQSVVQWTGNSPSGLTHIHITGQTLTFVEPSGTTFTRNVPSAVVTYDPSAQSATTSWNSTAFRWDTVVPASYSGAVFASGFALFVGTGGIPGGTKVTWSAQFHTSESCLSVNWKWAAAVYSKFTHLNGLIGVKPVDDNKLSQYQNSDHAGTPENFKSDLVAGARGGGGSNFTGSLSGTVAVKGGSCP